MKSHHLKHAGFFLAVLALLFNTAIVATSFKQEVNAAGGAVFAALDASVAPASTTVGGTVTVTLYSYVYQCNDTYNGGTHYAASFKSYCDNHGGFSQIVPWQDGFRVTISGSGNNTTGVSSDDYGPIITTNASGNASFTLTSSVAESKTIDLQNGAQTVTKTVSFTTPSSATTTTTTTKKTTTTTTTTTPATSAPAATSVSNVTFNGQANQSSTDAAKAPEFKADDSIVLTGTATPNTKIHVYVFSDPQMVETTTDKDGKWTVTLPKLPAGDHHVESAVVDSKGQEGTRQQLGVFKVLAAQTTSAVTKPTTVATTKKTSTNWKLVLPITIVSLLAIAYVVWYWLHHKSSLLNHHNVKPPAPTTPIEPTKQN